MQNIVQDNKLIRIDITNKRLCCSFRVVKELSCAVKFQTFGTLNIKHKSIGFNDLVIGIILTTILLKYITMQHKKQNVIENSNRDRSCEIICN